MGDDIEALAAAQGGVIMRVQALAYGLTPGDLADLVAAGDWLAVRKGMFAPGALRHADNRVRHRADVAAALLSYGGAGALGMPATGGLPRLLAGHGSAAMLWDLPCSTLRRVRPNPPSAQARNRTVLLGPGQVELINTDRGRRATRHGVRVRPAAVPPGHAGWLGVIPTTSRARTAVDLARRLPHVEAVAVCDAALHAGTAEAELAQVARSCARWPGAQRASDALAFADGRAGSAAESWARVILWEAGYRELDLQVEVREGGVLRFLLDLVVGGRVAIETDGKIKYTDPWGTPGDVLWNEKLREDAIRDLGYEVVRTTWDELTRRPAAFLAKVRRALERLRLHSG